MYADSNHSSQYSLSSTTIKADEDFPLSISQMDSHPLFMQNQSNGSSISANDISIVSDHVIPSDQSLFSYQEANSINSQTDMDSVANLPGYSPVVANNMEDSVIESNYSGNNV